MHVPFQSNLPPGQAEEGPPLLGLPQVLHCLQWNHSALHCTMLYTALHCTALYYALHFTALHCTALHCTALHYSEVKGSALRFTASSILLQVRGQEP